VRRARAVLTVAACLAFALLGLLGVGLAHAQADDRADIEQNLHQRAVLTAALLDSVFQSVAGQATQAPSLYATRQVNAQVLDDHVANARDLAVTDGSGKVLAASSGFDAQTGRELSGSAAMRTVLWGAPLGVGDVEPYRGQTVVDIAIAFTTPYGGRVVVVGADPAVFGVSATPELRSVPGVPVAVNTLLDSNDVVLATTSSARPGQRAPASEVRALVHPSGAIDGWYFEPAPLADTTLRVVRSAPEGALFAPVSGAHRLLPWLLLAACAAVAAVALVLGGAALRAGTRLRVLNQRLGSLNAELRSANVQLEQHATELAHSNEELDQFASIASHDLQEPLRKVRTYTQQLAVMEGDSLSEKGHEYLWRANAAGARMQTLIEDLLRYARLGTQGRAFEPVDLARLAAEVIDDLGAQIDEADATVTVGALPTIQGDEPQLRQLLQHHALFDVVTDLPNRALFVDRLERALRRYDRGPSMRHAVLFIDIDRFKLINDSFSHAVGDQLLRASAVRLSETVCSVDTVARIGGDEFTVLVEHLPAEDVDRVVTELSERVRESLPRGFTYRRAPPARHRQHRHRRGRPRLGRSRGAAQRRHRHVRSEAAGP
jgi:diguanylate cyclase (GGDEF)-like protein